jgi:hypothetical protein
MWEGFDPWAETGTNRTADDQSVVDAGVSAGTAVRVRRGTAVRLGLRTPQAGEWLVSVDPAGSPLGLLVRVVGGIIREWRRVDSGPAERRSVRSIAELYPYDWGR